MPSSLRRPNAPSARRSLSPHHPVVAHRDRPLSHGERQLIEAGIRLLVAEHPEGESVDSLRFDVLDHTNRAGRVLQQIHGAATRVLPVGAVVSINHPSRRERDSSIAAGDTMGRVLTHLTAPPSTSTRSHSPGGNIDDSLRYAAAVTQAQFAGWLTPTVHTGSSGLSGDSHSNRVITRRETHVPIAEERRVEAWGERHRPPAEVVQSKFPTLICPITHEPMRDPVVAADGFSYERCAIERWLATSNRSPTTNEPLPHLSLVSNHAARMILDSLDDHPVEDAEASAGDENVSPDGSAPSGEPSARKRRRIPTHK